MQVTITKKMAAFNDGDPPDYLGLFVYADVSDIVAKRTGGYLLDVSETAPDDEIIEAIESLYA